MATEKNILREIIKKHAKDTLLGNERENLNFVDVIYPFLEKIFGVDICTSSIENGDALQNYYEENYIGNPSFSEIVFYVERLVELCEATQEERELLGIANDLDKYAEKVKTTKKVKSL